MDVSSKTRPVVCLGGGRDPDTHEDTRAPPKTGLATGPDEQLLVATSAIASIVRPTEPATALLAAHGGSPGCSPRETGADPNA